VDILMRGTSGNWGEKPPHIFVGEILHLALFSVHTNKKDVEMQK
jgi:hypothetical protein